MARIPINYGTTPGDGTGDVLFTSFKNIDDNFIDLYANTVDSIILIKQASDFGTIDSTKAYLIDGTIDMGSTSIEIPAGGINILGLTVGVSKLISSENNYTMFTSPVGGSGGVIKVDMIISVTGTSSQVYDLTDVDGTHIIRLGTTDFIDCTSLGEITGYFTGIETACARFGGSPSLTLSGTWAGGYRQQTCIIALLSSGFSGAVFYRRNYIYYG